MKLPNQRGQDMGVLQIVIVIGAIHVGGHGADEIAPVFAAICLAHFDARDFRDGIPLVARFQWAREQGILLHRLRRKFWINAGAAEEQKFFDLRHVRAVDQVILDLKVLVKEFGGVGIVGVNAANFGCGVENIFRLFLRKKLADGFGVQQIQFGPGFADELGKTLLLQFSPDGAAYEPAMAGYKYPGVFIHKSVC